MVETLQRPRFNNESLKRDSNAIVFDIQRTMVRNRGFVDFDGKFHESLYLTNPQIILDMKTLLAIIPQELTKTTTGSQRIIDAGWGPLWGSDSDSLEARRAALKRLLTLSNIASDDLKQKYQKGEITEAEFRDQMQPVEGTRLSAFSDLYPEKYKTIERSRTLK